MINICEMMDSVKIVDFPCYEERTRNSEIYCNFEIKENALIFTDKSITVLNYSSVNVYEYNMCKKLYPQMHPDNEMVFIELWVKQKRGAERTHFYFEVTKEKCKELYAYVEKYVKEESIDSIIKKAFTEI